MPRTYFYVKPYGSQWKVIGAAYAGPTVYRSRHEALALARNMAHNLFKLACRPTGVRIEVTGTGQDGLPSWQEDEQSLFGEE